MFSKVNNDGEDGHEFTFANNLNLHLLKVDNKSEDKP